MSDPEAKKNIPCDESVIDYFSQRAGAYGAKSDGWPWLWLRVREEKALFDVLGDIDGQTIADLGSGTGYYSRKALERGAKRVFAVDVTPQMVLQCNITGVQAIQGDVAAVTLPEPVDAVIAAGVLEFVSDPLAVLENAARNCKATGKMAILVPPNRIFPRLYAAFHKSHGVTIRLFSVADLKKHARKAGWCIVDEKNVWPFARAIGFEKFSD